MVNSDWFGVTRPYTNFTHSNHGTCILFVTCQNRHCWWGKANIGTLCGRDCWWACLASRLARRSQRTVCGVPECPPLQTWGSFQEGWLRWQSHWQDGCRSYLHEGIKYIQTDISLWQYWLRVACTVYWHGGKHILWVWHYWPVAVLRGGAWGGLESPQTCSVPPPGTMLGQYKISLISSYLELGHARATWKAQWRGRRV